eukprot:CAMPEP_0174239596 /NCGR_PEP_ID=MMETSP0417-20130205/15359_1 /TAXON_ID=242541 /ORGANISM="Mayorella sp, Strain BSH-02190019" /LENGTH=557 /DNA_ID=CAMNT_0015318557 /DNA_START=94 /DNA_END=1764 /DNA_ORIENTATION=-
MSKKRKALKDLTMEELDERLQLVAEQLNTVSKEDAKERRRLFTQRSRLNKQKLANCGNERAIRSIERARHKHREWIRRNKQHSSSSSSPDPSALSPENSSSFLPGSPSSSSLPLSVSPTLSLSATLTLPPSDDALAGRIPTNAFDALDSIASTAVASAALKNTNLDVQRSLEIASAAAAAPPLSTSSNVWTPLSSAPRTMPRRAPAENANSIARLLISADATSAEDALRPDECAPSFDHRTEAARDQGYSSHVQSGQPRSKAVTDQPRPAKRARAADGRDSEDTATNTEENPSERGAPLRGEASQVQGAQTPASAVGKGGSRFISPKSLCPFSLTASQLNIADPQNMTAEEARRVLEAAAPKSNFRARALSAISDEELTLRIEATRLLHSLSVDNRKERNRLAVSLGRLLRQQLANQGDPEAISTIDAVRERHRLWVRARKRSLKNGDSSSEDSSTVPAPAIANSASLASSSSSSSSFASAPSSTSSVSSSSSSSSTSSSSSSASSSSSSSSPAPLSSDSASSASATGSAPVSSSSSSSSTISTSSSAPRMKTRSKI